MNFVRMMLWPAGLGLCVLAYASLRDRGDLTQTEAALVSALLFIFLAAGLVTWTRRPENRIGPLLTVFALIEAASTTQHSTNDVLFTIGYVLAPVPVLMLGHIALAYPTGRLETVRERRYLEAFYLLVVAAAIARLAVYDPALQQVGIGDCVPAEDNCPDSVIAIAPDDEAFAIASLALVALYIAVPLLVLALFVRRFLRATPRRRQMLTPLLGATTLLAAAIVAVQAADVGTQSEIVKTVTFAAGALAQLAIVAVVVFGLLRSQFGRGAIAPLLLQLEQAPPDQVRVALAQALGDKTLEVLYWLPERQAYVDADGEPAALPSETVGRAVTRIDNDGAPLAALVYDIATRDDPTLVESAAAAARLALENARLQAELRAQLQEVRESRARIVAAGDAERRRLERNIHDGAQQRTRRPSAVAARRPAHAQRAARARP